MKVLFVASECAPFIKTGGLADVIGAVPKALTATGTEVKVLIPAYPALHGLADRGRPIKRIDDLFGGKALVKAVRAEGLDLLLLLAPHLYDRDGNIYLGPDGQDWSDNHLRFAALGYAGAELALDGADGWVPDVVHVHDWQTGLLPAYLSQSGRSSPPVVTTIHNIAFQGLFESSELAKLKLKREMFAADAVEYYGKISFLKAGLVFADKITTVSPSYACELLTPELGMGLDGLLRERRRDLTGVLNGIDLDAWNPESDPHLVDNYTARSLKRKAANKRAVEARFGLRRQDGPLFCVVSRLTLQKGLDMLLECLPGLLAEGASLAVLGSGDRTLERQFTEASSEHPGQVGVIIGYDEPLSHLLQGGSDAILIPSRFEPCGLTQLYGLRYGTLPIVARTGGLADTIIDANQAALTAECATGFQFSPINAATLDRAIARACEIFRQPRIWSAMMRKAMRHPVGWGASTSAYTAIYQGLIVA